MSEKNIQQDRPAFHGSDIEQIEQYYKIPAESIIKFGDILFNARCNFFKYL